MNKVFMIGNLTKDPDLRSTGNGVSVCSFRIAVNRRFPNQAGERVSDFFDVVAWRQTAEFVSRKYSVTATDELLEWLGASGLHYRINK